MKLIVTVSGTYRYLQKWPFLTVTVQFSDRYLQFWGVGGRFLGYWGTEWGCRRAYEKHFSFPRINRLIAGVCKGLIVRVM